MMCRKAIYLTVLIVVGIAPAAVVAGVAYPAPDAWWTYIYNGDAAAGGDPPGTQGYNALDGTWSHENGSDVWERSPIGAGSPGGVSALTEGDTKYVRLQDTGDPRSHNMPDPSNRKLYFGHSITNDIGAAAATILNDGVTISFRARIAKGGLLDQVHTGGQPAPWPAGGDGYVLHDAGKDIFGVRQSNGDMLVSFALALTSDDDEIPVNGLVMNDLNGTTASGNVDQQDNDGGTVNILEIADPTVWHEFWITIQADPTGTGTHLAKIYVDGSLEPQPFYVTAGNGNDYEDSYIALGLGATPQTGAIDVDFFAYKQGVLSPADVYRASNPDPANGALVADTWVNLSWVAGASAASHDIYLGDDFDQVKEGTGGTFRINQAQAFYVAGFPGYAYPDGLVPGTTYYWRIDEVEADGITKHKGEVWSFSIPPRTAYNPSPADGAQFVGPDNVTLSWTTGFGAKLHTVYFGDSFDMVSNAVGGLPQGTATYKPASLQAEKVYYWRVDEFDGTATHKGNVWAFTTPGAAGNPEPANGAAGVQMTAKLSWTPATNATSHQVYFGTDKEAVKNATTASPEYKGSEAKGSESYDPGKLAWHTAYYWRVDAVYSTGAVKGLVWSFTTADFLLVDDFESYNDIDPPDPASNRIFDKWKDGFETPTTNGALVGYDLPPYAEPTIVHSGAQSMPYRYDNANKTSEATMTLVYPRDWTEEGVGQLSLWFRGAAANAAERMYVALNGGTPVYHADPKAAQKGGWNQWVIDLPAFQGVTLTNVNTLTIGFGTKGSPAAGGAGKVYFDDLRLYRP